ncbi:MAG TPA: bi-domain-containing oxidoreductase [Candidatus Krumholzibacteria bacterium]|nr:bi-domain-containing oxidoreductase [Candidatus Krumholzibacteria bacterium]
MKQLLQDLANGTTHLVEAPAPVASPGTLVIDSTVSLVSAGTERMLVEFGRGNLLDKARQQPEKVAMVLQKARTDGLMATLDAVRSKLGQPIPLGYANVGVVAEVGAGVTGFAVGDRVVSNGSHADVVRVPVNLCARIPDGVDDETAAFTVVASIGLQGLRLAAPTLGERFVVTGAGLIGLLTVQMLRANGCRVLAIDLDERKLALARGFGAETCNPARGEDPVAAGLAFSGGAGVDGVIITASTKSSDPVTQAARMSRKRGRIVLVGVTGLELNRSDFYDKELTFQVSCSYGPGRYDAAYEDQGHDYPLGFVRWTEQRNFAAVLDMMADGRLVAAPLVSHRFPFADAAAAYDTLAAGGDVLGMLLQYADESRARHARVVELAPTAAFAAGKPVVAFFGAGNYASRVLIPAFAAAGAQLSALVTSGGPGGAAYGRKAGFARVATDPAAALGDAATGAVVIATRHDSHALLVVQALEAGKHVFVEKPLAITADELAAVEAAYARAHAAGRGPRLMVGFNRRFSPLVRMKELLDAVPAPRSFILTMNAGALPANHWTQDPQVGGGRIIGEACHYVDLMRHLAGSPIVSVAARGMGVNGAEPVTEDKAVIVLGFADGSFGSLHYLANGHAGFPKERVEVFTGGRSLHLDNFRSLAGHGWPGFKGLKLRRQDKGQGACPAAFLAALGGDGPSPIPADEIFEVTRATLDAAAQLRAR